MTRHARPALKIPTLLVGVVFLSHTSATLAQCELHEVAKLTASDAAGDDYFGGTVSVSGDVAIVGASGSAYVYWFNGSMWVEQAKLTASDAAALDSFGGSVSVSGDVAIVGAYGGCATWSNCGSAYVYRFNGSTWVEQAKFCGCGYRTIYFAASVSVSGDVAIVGAPYTDCTINDDNCGSAYVYRFNGSTWILQTILRASDAAEDDYFGSSVSVSGDVAIVGAVGSAAYVYRFNGSTWIEEAKLASSDATAYDSFGGAVSVSGDSILVGAYGDACAAGCCCGSTYVYRFNGSTWVEEQKLTASDAAASDYFGESVSVSGDAAVVGSKFHDCAAGGNCGSAYLYRFDGNAWIQVKKLTASNVAASNYFGVPVSVSGDVALVGSRYDDCAAGGNCGSTYVFGLGSLPLPPDCNDNLIGDECEFDCNGSMVPDDCDIANGTSEDCNINGVPDECDIASASSTDANANGIPDECDTNLPPFVIHAPVNQLVCADSAAEFAVQPGGMPPFTYQWRKDKVNLDGETSDTLTLSSVGEDDQGNYEVVITNSLGSTISEPATLSIAPFSEYILAPAPDGVPRNRYIGVVPPSIPCTVAIRVRLISLQQPNPPNYPGYSPPNYSAYEFGPGCTDPGGCVRWVGASGTHLEVQEIPSFGTFQAASLQCTPHYQDWSEVGFFSVTGAEIVPSSLYEVEVFPASCAGNEDTCTNVSLPLQIATARWGDIAERRNPPSTTAQPDAIDIVWLVNKLKAFPGALSNTVVQLQPNVPNIDADVNALDIVTCVDAFKGFPYPFIGPCPCPSLVTCNTTACTLTSHCTGPYGPGAVCVHTCVGGPKAGERCTANRNCRVCEGGSADGRQCGSGFQPCPGGVCPTGPVCSSSGFCHDACARCTP